VGPHALPLQARCVLPLLRLRSLMLLRNPTTHTTHEGAWYSTKRRIMTSMTRNKYFRNSTLPAARCGAHVWHAAPGLSTHWRSSRHGLRYHLLSFRASARRLALAARLMFLESSTAWRHKRRVVRPGHLEYLLRDSRRLPQKFTLNTMVCRSAAKQGSGT
jgi:hypothetical protein